MDPLNILYALDAAAGMGGLLFNDNSTEKLLQLLRSFTDPSVIAGDTNKLFRLLLQSPAYASSVNDILAAANSAQGSTAANLAERGLTTSGIGAITSGVGSSLSGLNISRLNADYMKQALERAIQLAQIRIGGAQGLRPPRNIGADIYASGVNMLGDITKIMANRPKTQMPVGQTSLTGVPPISRAQSIYQQVKRNANRFTTSTGLEPMF